jgi:hypothetical protein
MIVPATWSIPPALRQRIGVTTYGRQRAIVEGEDLVLVLHRAPRPDESEREGVLFWRDARGEWHATRGPAGATGLKRFVQSYGEAEVALSERFEAAQTTDALFDILAELTPLVRAARNLYGALQTGREAIGADPALIEARDLAYDAQRNVELLLEDVRNAIHYRTAREAEEQARSGRESARAAHRLNVLAALFLPVTALASLVGMGLEPGWDPRQPGLFWIVLGIAVVLGLATKAWVLSDPKDRSKP